MVHHDTLRHMLRHFEVMKLHVMKVYVVYQHYFFSSMTPMIGVQSLQDSEVTTK